MWNRPTFLRAGGLLGASAWTATGKAASFADVEAAAAAVAGRSPEEVAQDELYWREIQEAFTLDRTISNLNDGDSCPSPRVVHEGFKRYADIMNPAPVYDRGLIERNLETVRRTLAAEFGCDAEAIAITRNSVVAAMTDAAKNGVGAS